MVQTPPATRSSAADTDVTIGQGRVVQVNVSVGGVPKRPVPSARVERLGLVGDTQAGLGVHGGPHRAVCLLATEVIRRVASEGHPIVPGSVGENLTTEGVELALLEPGTRLRFGGGLELEISAPANPCDTIRGSFSDGKSGRISIIKFPSDSRVYARVLAEGVVTAGDGFVVLPPLPGTRATLHLLLERLERHEVRYWEATWAAVAAGGADLRLLDLGDAHACAAPAIPGLIFNRLRPPEFNLRSAVVDPVAGSRAGWWTSNRRSAWPGTGRSPLLSEPDRVRKPGAVLIGGGGG
jgi:MOSC domain-containing protein YiiM